MSLTNYKKFIANHKLLKEGYVEDYNETEINKIIDNAYKHFKELHIKVNSKDIIEYIEQEIGKEMDDNDYEILYYKITGENLESDEISDLDDEEKYYIS